MAESIKIDFAALAERRPPRARRPAGPVMGRAPWWCSPAQGIAFGAATKAYLGADGEALGARAAAAAKFKGKLGAALDIVAPGGLAADRLLVVGVGSDKSESGTGASDTADTAKEDNAKPFSLANLGGTVAGKIGRGTRALVVLDLPRETRETPAEAAAELAMGLRLRDYRFDAYKTKKKKDEAEDERRDAGDDRRRRPGRRREGGRRARRRGRRHPHRAHRSSTSRRTCSIPKASQIGPRRWNRSGSRSRCSTCRRWRSSAWARSSASARARRGRAASSSCAGTAPARPTEPRRQEAARLHRQGRHLRHRRHLDQAVVWHGGHEGRHGGAPPASSA